MEMRIRFGGSADHQEGVEMKLLKDIRTAGEGSRFWREDILQRFDWPREVNIFTGHCTIHVPVLNFHKTIADRIAFPEG